MKIFSPFVKKHFSARPIIVCFSFFFTCLCIDLPVIFSQQVDSYGTYFIFDDMSNTTKNFTFYYTNSSGFSKTLLGRTLSAFTVFTNLFLLVVVGIILNIVSVLKYKSYVRQRREREKTYNRVPISNHNNQQTVTNMESGFEIQHVSVEHSQSYRQKLTQKEINENRAEKNMFYMALTLCSISILSRILLIISAIYFILFNSFSTTLITYALNITIQTLVPTSAIFVFYSFNKMFREECSRIFSSYFKATSSGITDVT
jgi:hypothetical protein